MPMAYRVDMEKVEEYHSSLGASVYHNNGRCTLGNNIEKKNKKSGKGGKSLCSQCASLNKQRK